MNKKYYFTYGSDGHPYIGGWTEVEAPDAKMACMAFRAVHPDKGTGLPELQLRLHRRSLSEKLHGCSGRQLQQVLP